jgi:GH15 family glucan-1,4-alpha-glucosidase
MFYPGLGYIGSGKIAGLYGLNETIHDQKSIGLQHLYIDDYKRDFIYQGMTVVKVDDVCYYGDRIKPKNGHPEKKESKKSYSKNGFQFVDEFSYENFDKTDLAYCSSGKMIVFSSLIKNTSKETKEFEISSFLITTNQLFDLHRKGQELVLKSYGKTIQVITEETDAVCRVSKDSPSGFMYHGIQNLLFEENEFGNGEFTSEEPIAVSLSKKVALEPNEEYQYNWCLNMASVVDSNSVDFASLEEKGIGIWEEWISESEENIDDCAKANLIALKAINLQGFIPADLTGHYFASQNVSFYVRDALHGARAFLYSGHYKECREVVELVSKLKRKENYELIQRYNSELEPDEGANNNVFSQIDVIGYLLRVVADYYHLTGNLLIDISDLINEYRILESIERKNGLYGPEGGVNEGVYGPAFITSTNIFIVGGLTGLIELMDAFDYDKNSRVYNDVKNTIREMTSAINANFLEEGYFAYGYISYDEQIVKRYDTPQLFGASLGYPIDENYKANFEKLTEIASYFGYGYGYSEQQYHDGPWIFNTAYAAQNACIFEKESLYNHIMEWLENHKNNYGLLPEAIDARDETKSFINPLMWANAEYICAKYASKIKRLRLGE